MKNAQKLLSRFVGILLLSGVFILVFNIILMLISFSDIIFKTSNESPWKIAEQTAMALTHREHKYLLSDEKAELLTNQNAWAILIQNNTGNVVWHTENLPHDVPQSYTVGEISTLSRAYLGEYPTFTCSYEDDLIVLGFPKKTYWKLIYNSWDYSFIKNVPFTLLIFIAGNLLLIFLIYFTANSRLFRSIDPIVEGIEALPLEKNIVIKETGVLSDIASCINKTSSIIQKQKYQLKKRENARANWIAGVSHDIRTPLSMVMGYASQLESDEHLTEDEKQKAAIIRHQSERIKNLINDLNIASKLEYNMQPVNFEKVNLVALARQVTVDFINMDIEEKYPIDWLTDDKLVSCKICGDTPLLKRAIVNLIQNCINHNPHGCTIYITVEQNADQCLIKVEDNGVGAARKEIEKLNNTPHYMVCDENIMEQRHGLGLLIVKQIVAAHQGNVIIGQSAYDGFLVTLSFPM